MDKGYTTPKLLCMLVNFHIQTGEPAQIAGSPSLGFVFSWETPLSLGSPRMNPLSLDHPRKQSTGASFFSL